MKLHNGVSLWNATFQPARQYPALMEDIDCEVLVIGGGESGSLVSYRLTELGVDTVLVDKRGVAQGTSSANTGLLQFSNDKSLTSCIHTFGEAEGVRFYKLCQEALMDLESISRKLAYDPEFIRRDSLCFASCPEDVPKLREEYDSLRRFGFPVEYWETPRIEEHFSFSKAAAVYARDEAEVNPYKLVNALVDTSFAKGLRIYENTEVYAQSMQEGRLVFQAGRHRIRAQYAVYATGYETQENKRNPNAVMTSTFAIATKPVAAFTGWHERCLIWETARPYLYIRTTADNRIVVGGLDEGTTIPEERDRMQARKSELLLEALQKLFPNIPGVAVDYSWSAAFGSTHDGFPLIGRQEQFPNSLFLLGYGGNGTISSVLGSKLVAECIVKGNHPDMELFRLDRPSHALTEQGDYAEST